MYRLLDSDRFRVDSRNWRAFSWKDGIWHFLPISPDHAMTMIRTDCFACSCSGTHPIQTVPENLLWTQWSHPTYSINSWCRIEHYSWLKHNRDKDCIKSGQAWSPRIAKAPRKVTCEKNRILGIHRFLKPIYITFECKVQNDRNVSLRRWSLGAPSHSVE